MAPSASRSTRCCLKWDRRKPPPGNFPGPDNSWEIEFTEFLEDIRLERQPRPGIADAQAALRIVERVYRENAT